jgi:hypothetical protein
MSSDTALLVLYAKIKKKYMARHKTLHFYQLRVSGRLARTSDPSAIYMLGPFKKKIGG